MNNLYIVTTEGDCEGRTTRDLGIWQGKISDIALYLANKCVYKLTFKPVAIGIPKEPTKSEVPIQIYKTSEINLKSLSAIDDKIINVHIDRWGNTTATASNLKKEELEKIEAEKFLSKYSPEELAAIEKFKKVLGE